MSKGIIKSIKQKNTLFYLSKCQPTLENIANYKTYKNKLTNVIRNAERNHFTQQLELNKSDLKKTWSVMKTIIGSCKAHNHIIIKHDNMQITDEADIADKFNVFFTSVGNNLSKKFINDNGDPLKYISSTLNSISIPEFTESDILAVISSLKNSSAGYDDIPSSLIKKIRDEVAKPLTILINNSIRTGIFPSELKIAKVIPLFKSESTMDVKNYRLISLVSVFSKIFEKLVYNHVVNFMNKYNLLYKLQFGFRKEHSTQH